MATDNTEMEVHQATYGKVIKVMQYGAVAVFLIAFGVIWLISGK